MNATNKRVFKKLPADICPLHYEICLQPNLTTFVCKGKENVHVDIKNTTNIVVLNSVDLEFISINFHTLEGKLISSKSISIDHEQETVKIEFMENLPSGQSGYLSFIYQGEINNKMKGLYKSKYTTINGDVKYAAVTQFQSTDARRCFPCWDEPAYKCTFDITLQIPADTPGLVALSNMPQKSKTKGAECLETVIFETTPKMSTYLVALVIGEFDYIESKTSDGILVRVYTPIGKKEQGQFALEVATKVLPYYYNYFKISYPLPKIDLIAIADFSSGAMENWGLVIFRETCLLVDVENTATIHKQWIALVVAHELAHQWFGNLVTMEWWDDLWLNEGYASFVEFLCVAHLFPHYDIWTQFVTNVHIKALELDALRNSHAIQVAVGHPSEIDEIFDDISYCKGASVLRMLHSYIGDENFKRGMKLYLDKFSYANATTNDLWSCLEQVAEKPIRAFMSTWTKQQGFPLVHVVQQRLNHQPNNIVVTLHQKPFSPDDNDDDGDDDDYDDDTSSTTSREKKTLWIIPLTVSVAHDSAKILDNVMLKETSVELVIENVPSDSWIKVNSGTIGFYRVLYSYDMLQLFLPAIKNRTLPPLDRLGLLDDLFAITRRGHSNETTAAATTTTTTTVDVLQLMQAFQLENDYIVWCTILNCLEKIGQLISHLDNYENAFKAFGRYLLRDVSLKLGWEAKNYETHLEKLLRPRILGKLISLDDEETIVEAKRRFALHITEQEILSADLRSIVYRAVLSTSHTSAQGHNEIFETMLRLYRECDLHEEKNRILTSLGAVKDEQLLTRVLQYSLSDQVRAQDATFVITSVANSYKGRMLAWEFLKENWDTLLDRYKGGFLLAGLVKHVTENFVTHEKALEIEQFFNSKNEKCLVQQTVEQSVESIRINAAWLNRDKDKIQEFLVSYQ